MLFEVGLEIRLLFGFFRCPTFVSHLAFPVNAGRRSIGRKRLLLELFGVQSPWNRAGLGLCYLPVMCKLR